jgi:hypothetical protein
MGPKVAMGHALAEVVVFLLIVVGLASVAEEHTGVVAVIGGAALVLFGLLSLKGAEPPPWRSLPGAPRLTLSCGGPHQRSPTHYFLGLVAIHTGPHLVLAELREGLLSPRSSLSATGARTSGGTPSSRRASTREGLSYPRRTTKGPSPSAAGFSSSRGELLGGSLDRRGISDPSAIDINRQNHYTMSEGDWGGGLD